ncbi:hypothetical protein TorRG33x02_231980 [Trema orientale]|uniref:Transmembrane protein n=1 Tax=Trema orientale TaxID=63057 RepID=A0A2P5E5Z7_TREOI|nr:hypothetical protein TorRG33x02_231980 [Trema orientale]
MAINIYYLITDFIKLLLHSYLPLVAVVFLGICGFSGQGRDTPYVTDDARELTDGSQRVNMLPSKRGYSEHAIAPKEVYRRCRLIILP